MKQTTINYILLALVFVFIIAGDLLIYFSLPKQTKPLTRQEIIQIEDSLLTVKLAKIKPDTTLNKTIYLIKESEKQNDTWITKLDSTTTDSILYSLAKEFEAEN